MRNNIKNKITDIVILLLIILVIVIPVLFVIAILSGCFDIKSVLATIGTSLLELLFVACLYLLDDKPKED